MKLNAVEIAKVMFAARGRAEGMTEAEINQKITENVEFENEFDDYLVDAELMVEWFEANEPEARALADLILAQPVVVPVFNEEFIIDELAEKPRNE